MLNLTRRALLLGGTSTLGVLALPVWSQPSADYYSEYRRGLINRHIARNGCLMQQIWMVPSAPNQATDAVWQTIARTGPERFKNASGGGFMAEMTSSPLLLDINRTAVLGSSPVVVGGGDNPLLEGGLALMCFAIEILERDTPLDSSQIAARRLLDFILASEIQKQEDGQRIGYLLRRRNWWSAPAPASLDEYCGVLLGAWFYVQAMEKIGDDAELNRTREYLDRLGRQLKSDDYLIPHMGFQDLGGQAWHPQTGRDVWGFQFAFTRIFRSVLGVSHLSGKTIPDQRGGSFANLTGLSPAGLMEHILNRIHRGDFFEPTFYNMNIVAHAMLMLLPTIESGDRREEIWEQGQEFFVGLLANGGLRNPYFGLIWQAWAERQGDTTAGDVPRKMYGPIRNPVGQLFPRLPMREVQNGDPTPPARRLNERSDDGARHLWGRTFLSTAPWRLERAELESFGLSTNSLLPDFEKLGRDMLPLWDQLAAIDKDRYTLRVGIGVLGEIGPPRAGDRRDASSRFYTPLVDEGFYIEGSGLRYMVCRMLAVYFGKMRLPAIDDTGIATLPADGPEAGPYTHGVSFWPRDIRRTISVARRAQGPQKDDYHILYASEDDGIREFYQDNTRVGAPMRPLHRFGGNREYDEVAAIHSTYGNPEVIARSGDNLRHFFRRGNSWSSGRRITGDANGGPGFIQSTFGQRVNFEVVVPREGDGFLHLYRNNDPGANEAWTETRFGGNFNAEAVALIQSSYGILEIVVRDDDDRLFHFWRSTSGNWSNPIFIADGVRGTPGFIQSTGGRTGNFEVIVPSRSSGLKHFYRDNDAPGLPWLERDFPEPYNLIDFGDMDGVSVVQRPDGDELDIYTTSDGGRFFYTRASVSQPSARMGALDIDVLPYESGKEPNVVVRARNIGSAAARGVFIAVSHAAGTDRLNVGTVEANGQAGPFTMTLPVSICNDSNGIKFTAVVSGDNFQTITSSKFGNCRPSGGSSGGSGDAPGDPDLPPRPPGTQPRSEQPRNQD